MTNDHNDSKGAACFEYTIASEIDISYSTLPYV